MYTSHGTWQYHIDVPVLYIDLDGGYNLEAVISFAQDLTKAVSEYPAGALKHCVLNLSHWDLITNDALTAARKYFEQVAKRGYETVDYLLPNNIIAKSVLNKLWQDLGVTVTFYESYDEYLAKYPERQYVNQWRNQT